MPMCSKKKRKLFSWVLWSFWATFSFHCQLSVFINIPYIYWQSWGWVLSPSICVCDHLHVCAHACVQNSPSLMNHRCRDTFCCFIAVCYPSLFCLRQLHRNAECCSALFFAFSLSVYFFSFSSFPVWVTFQAQICSGGSWAALCQGCSPHVQGHAGRCRRPRCPTALMLPDSCDYIQEGRSEQERVSVLCFYLWLCCEK